MVSTSMLLTKGHECNINGILPGLLVCVSSACGGAQLAIQAVTPQLRQVLLHHMLPAPLDLGLKPA